MMSKDDIDLGARKKELQRAHRESSRQAEAQHKTWIGETFIGAGGGEKFPTLKHVAGLVLRALAEAQADPSIVEDCLRRGEAFFRRKSKPAAGKRDREENTPAKAPSNGAAQTCGPALAAKPAKSPKSPGDLLPGLAPE